MHLEFDLESRISCYSIKIRKLCKGKPTLDTKLNLVFEITGVSINKFVSLISPRFTMKEQHRRPWRHLVMSFES
jgi:hypothetical protein